MNGAFASRYGVVVLERSTETVRVGCLHRPTRALRAILERHHGVPVELVQLDPREVRSAVSRAGIAGDAPVEQDVRGIEGAFEGAVARLVRDLLRGAVERGATDLYLRARAPDNAPDNVEDAASVGATVSMRVGGRVGEETVLPAALYRGAVRHLLSAAGADPLATLPVDARLSVPYLPNVPLRLAYVTDGFSGALAVRFLRRAVPHLDELGLEHAHAATIRRLVRAPHGLMVLCGPTGSGKSTTAAALVAEIARQGRNVVSLEDPVEYHVPRVLQIESTDPAGALPMLLRHDPDAIWIGEVRDEKSASAAVRAALTGHLVITTLHCASAAHCVPRLLELGVKRSGLQSCLRAVVAQRLLGDPAVLAAEVWIPSALPWPVRRAEWVESWRRRVARESHGALWERVPLLWAAGRIDGRQACAELEVLT